ncbi:hypothetical protein NSS70_07105 [Aeribacillus sp. FSL K6-2848]|jgi:hypothetical protein|uniref:hypothetical protein n=1 Tax=unclassified Aeribacillus TaxID=2640495 RepID=UPI0030D3BB72
MDKVEKVKVLSQLFDLINYYYEYRDQPADDHFIQSWLSASASFAQIFVSA